MPRSLSEQWRRMSKTATAASASAQRQTGGDMVWISSGTFLMGSDRHYPEEAPAHSVHVSGFWIDRTPITNREFRRFVEATGYVTFAEIAPDAKDYPGALPHMLKAGSLVFTPPGRPVDLHNFANWWQFQFGANWRRPYGPGSSIMGMGEHPVVHVAYRDIEAYVRWVGKSLPTEAEWEFAARGGLEGAEFAWGDELAPDGRHLANTWQGEFPWQNLLEDGFEGTAPAGSFPPNGYGLHEMTGNVWEWTTDWFAGDRSAESCCAADSYDPAQPQFRIPRKVVKGGSFLCADSYCLRYRPSARRPQMLDTGMSHIGFRCISR